MTPCLRFSGVNFTKTDCEGEGEEGEGEEGGGSFGVRRVQVCGSLEAVTSDASSFVARLNSASGHTAAYSHREKPQAIVSAG